jgi:signal transduction histidine kinase
MFNKITKYLQRSVETDLGVLHQLIADMMIMFAFGVTIIISIFYALTENWQMLPGGLAGASMCGLSVWLNRYYKTAAKMLFVIAANFLVVLSHQQFNGQIPTYLYFFATASGPLVLFEARNFVAILSCALMSFGLGMLTIIQPNLLGMSPPILPPGSVELIVPVVYLTSFMIAIAPPALLFLLSNNLNDRVLREQARRFHSSRLQSLGEIAAGVAHEINNPLAVVAAKAEALLERLESPTPAVLKKMQQDLEFIDRNCGHIARIVRTLQNYSRQSAGDAPALTHLRSLIVDTCMLMKQMADKSHTQITIHCPDDIHLPLVNSEMMQALSNLISNAIDAQLTVEESKRMVEISGIRSADKVLITVADHGPGIDTADAPKIFEPFFTTKDPGKGTGLGLGIVQAIANRHHGIVRHDRVDQMTRFIIELPTQHELAGIDTKSVPPASST